MTPGTGAGQSHLQQQPGTMAALKGHGFIRAAEIGKRPGASAPERCLLLPTKTIPRGPKPVSPAPTFPARINPCPFKAKSSHILKCDYPGHRGRLFEVCEMLLAYDHGRIAMKATAVPAGEFKARTFQRHERGGLDCLRLSPVCGSSTAGRRIFSCFLVAGR